MLNSSSSIPLYQQLADRLRSAIAEEHYALGGRIPSEHALAERYGVGRPTVRQATELLVRQGVLERRRGAGTFVVETPRALDLFSTAGTLASFHAQGVEVEIQHLAGVSLGDVSPEAAQPFAGRRAYFLRRVSITEQGPALVEDTWLDPELFPGLEREPLEGRSLAALARERYGQVPSGGTQRFGVARADAVRADALGVSVGTPLLEVHRDLDFPHGDSAIHAELFCRTDLIVLTQNLGGA